jgi:tagaturonate reductase
MQAEASAYVSATLERFDNPFLDHRLADIAQNHAEKIQRRFQGFLDWSGSEAPMLRAIVQSSGTADRPG